MYVCVCVYTPFYFIHSSVSSIDGPFGCFHIFSIVNNATMSIRMYVSFRITVFVFFGIFQEWYIMLGIAGLYGSSIFSFFFRKLLTVFHGGCSNLYPHQHCMKVLFSSHPHQHLLFVFVLMIAILTDVR